MSASSSEPALRAGPQHRNEVQLVGRLAAAPELRTLPSGDVLASFRMVVGRSDAGRSTGAHRARPGRTRAVSVDTLDCVVWHATVRRVTARWEAGDVVEVTGALRRRFWRSAGATASRCEVEVVAARRVLRGSG